MNMKTITVIFSALAALACAAAPVDRGFLKSLVAIPSETAKPANVNKAVAHTKAYLEAHGVSCVVERDGERDILYASTRPGKTQDYLLCAHLDVVPASADLFTPRVEGEKIFGRGVFHDKGNVAVVVQVLVDLVGKASVGAIFETDEEIGGKTAATMVSRGYGARRMVLVVDGNPYNLIYAQKGNAYITVRAVGRGGHSSRPWQFDNPVDKLVDAYAKFRANRPPLADDHWCDVTSATVLSAGDAPNRIPDTADMTINLRFIRKDSVERVCKELRDVGLEVVKVHVSGQPVESDPSDPEMKRLLAALCAKWPEKNPQLERMVAATDARHFVDMNVPIAVVGCEGGDAHGVDEWADLRSMDEYVDLYERFILDAK